MSIQETRAVVRSANQVASRLETEIRKLREALAPFVAAHKKASEPMIDADLDDEQPRQVRVLLGDLRRAERVMRG